MTTVRAGTNPTLTTFTTYSSVAPASAAPPPTTVTCLVMASCWMAPTTTTVGSGPVAGLPSPSVRMFGSSTVSTTAWLLITVPAGVPGLTRSSNTSTPAAPGEIVPAPAPGSGGVMLDELMLMPEASGETPPSGWPTGNPFKSVEFATYVVFAGTPSVRTTPVAGMAAEFWTVIV